MKDEFPKVRTSIAKAGWEIYTPQATQHKYTDRAQNSTQRPKKARKAKRETCSKVEVTKAKGDSLGKVRNIGKRKARPTEKLEARKAKSKLGSKTVN